VWPTLMQLELETPLCSAPTALLRTTSDPGSDRSGPFLHVVGPTSSILEILQFLSVTALIANNDRRSFGVTRTNFLT